MTWGISALWGISFTQNRNDILITPSPLFLQEELVQRLGKKLLVLTNEQTNIAEESNANDLLGNDVALKVTQKVRPADASKFRSYVDDVGYITMLLLSLSGRLARTDNALHMIDGNHPDKVSTDRLIGSGRVSS